MHWLDGVTADCENDISTGQLLKTLSRTNPHELRPHPVWHNSEQCNYI